MALPNYKDLVEKLLAVPEEEEAHSEEETCYSPLLDTEAPGTPEKDGNEAYHEVEHGVAIPMEPPCETAPPMLENAGQSLEQGCEHPQLAFILHKDWVYGPLQTP